jgi:uncharacterized protein YqcC (DUF446 family)
VNQALLAALAVALAVAGVAAYLRWRRRRSVRRALLGELADEIEEELKRLGQWMPDPPPTGEVLAGGAFGASTAAFETWLQTILVPTLRQVAAGQTSIPRTSSIGAFAIREFGGVPVGDERRALLDLIHRVDRVANRR